MNTETEDKILDGLGVAMVGDMKFSKLLERIDDSDLLYQTDAYKRLLDVEAEDLSAQLRHRADMMRRRADEFDNMADKVTQARELIVKHVTDMCNTHETVRNLLYEHAHIKPSRT